MIGIDTNVLVRIITGDDPSAQRIALAYLARNAGTEPYFINLIVLVELVWVLESAYGYERGLVVSALDRLLRANDVRVEDSTSAWVAVRAYREGADFADALLAESNARAGCTKTATFDRAASRRIPAYELVAAREG